MNEIHKEMPEVEQTPPFGKEIIDLNFGGEYNRLELKYELEDILARLMDVEPRQLQLTNGSNGSLNMLLPVLALKFLSLQKGISPRAVLDTPNYFDTLKFLKASRYDIQTVPRTQKFELDTENFLKRITQEKPSLVVLTTPNNPTGIPISDEQIKKIIEATLPETVIIIDRTCINLKDEIGTKELLKKYPHRKLIVLHSFSKTHGMSADRIGFFVTNNTELADYLQTFEDDGRVSAYSMEKCKKSINDPTLVEKSRQGIEKSLRLLAEYAAENPDFIYTASSSNFVLVQLDPIKVQSLKKKFKFADGTKFGINNPRIFRLNLSNAERVRFFIQEYKKPRSA